MGYEFDKNLEAWLISYVMMANIGYDILILACTAGVLLSPPCRGSAIILEFDNVSLIS